MTANGIWEKLNVDRYKLLLTVWQQDMINGLLNCYSVIRQEVINNKRVDVVYIEVYCKLSISALARFFADSTKAYLRFDSDGAGKCLYYTVGYKVKS